jgi:hypothetical protein
VVVTAAGAVSPPPEFGRYGGPFADIRIGAAVFHRKGWRFIPVLNEWKTSWVKERWETKRVKREKEFEKSQICEKRKETFTIFLCAPPKLLRAPPFSWFWGKLIFGRIGPELRSAFCYLHPQAYCLHPMLYLVLSLKEFSCSTLSHSNLFLCTLFPCYMLC